MAKPINGVLMTKLLSCDKRSYIYLSDTLGNTIKKDEKSLYLGNGKGETIK